MVPNAWMELESIPLTPNGKVNRQALPEPEGMEKEYVLPRTPIEEGVAALWRDVLKLKRAGMTDNFFSVGGHSLLAIQLLSRVREVFKVEFPVRELFERPTPEAMSKYIARAARSGEPAALVPVSREAFQFAADGSFALPASFAQQRLWFLSQIEEVGPAYHIAGALRFRGRLDLDILQASLNEVVRRHESLRTTFRMRDGQVAQLVAPVAAIKLETVAAGGAGHSLDETVCKPFELEKGPLLRVALLRSHDDDHTLALTVHHIISDGWSLMVLIREIKEIYRALATGTASGLPALAIQYADYSQWQRDWVASAEFEPGLSDWKNKLEDVPALDIPTDYSRPRLPRHKGARERLQLSAALASALIEFSRREQTTLYIVLLAAFKLLLHRMTGSHDIAVGAPVAGRKRPQLELLIGCFLNTLVLRTRIPENLSFVEMLHLVREAALDAYSNEDVPFEKVLEALNPKRVPGQTPLFQALVNMLSLPEPLTMNLPDVATEIVELTESSSKFDITLYMFPGEGKIEFSLVYDTDLFQQARMVEMLRQFEGLLEQVVENPAEKIGRFSLVTHAAEQILPDPREVLDAAWVGGMHELFRVCAQRSPHQLAIADPEVTWTYGQLDKLSDNLAGQLVRQGIQRGDVVAIYAHRSAPLALALLGIMKAGSAFLVLDPVYPSARLAEYLEQANPAVLLEMEAARGRAA